MIKKSSVLLISLIGIVLATVAVGLPPTKPHKMATFACNKRDFGRELRTADTRLKGPPTT
jgi:hypothetical protein